MLKKDPRFLVTVDSCRKAVDIYEKAKPLIRARSKKNENISRLLHALLITYHCMPFTLSLYLCTSVAVAVEETRYREMRCCVGRLSSLCSLSLLRSAIREKYSFNCAFIFIRFYCVLGQFVSLSLEPRVSLNSRGLHSVFPEAGESLNEPCRMSEDQFAEL